MRLVGIGLGVGLLLALALSLTLRSFVFGIKATDPLTFAIAPMALLMAAGLAIYMPARQAVQIDPLNSLRHE